MTEAGRTALLYSVDLSFLLSLNSMFVMDGKLSDILSICTEAGRIMLENGAETFRVEDTLIRIASHYGMSDGDFFVLTNGILSSAQDQNGNSFGRVKFIPSNKANLAKVIAINQLSREICCGKYTLEEVKAELVRIDHLHDEPSWLLVAATALGSGAFAFLYNGRLTDSVGALTAGFILGLFLQFIAKKYLSKMTSNLLGSALVTVICLLFHHYGLSENMNAMIAGSIIPLIPGVSFVNGIRDIAKGDYLSGVVRLLDSLFVFICIATGVGAVLAFYARIRGGLSL